MPLTYSTDCEELAYSKDAKALKHMADRVIEHDGRHFEAFFRAGEKFAGHDVVWFNWHGDDFQTALLFVGTGPEVLSRLRKLSDRSVD